MNILHYGCPYFPYKGGSAVRLSRIVKEYANKVQCYIATPVESKSKVDDYPFVSSFREKNINKFKYDKEFKGYISNNDIDIVVIHNSRALINWFVFYKARFPRIKVVCEIHSFRDDSFIKERINKILYKLCDKIVVLSKRSQAVLIQKYNIDDSIIVYNGYNPEKRMEEEKIKEYNPSRIVYSYVGSFHLWQGVLLLCDTIEALHKKGFFDHHQVNLVGGGSCYQEVEDRLLQLKNPNIALHGWLEEQEAEAIITSSDFLLAPRISTIATESVVPLKVFESVQYRKPLISTPVGGLMELLILDDRQQASYFSNDCTVESLTSIFENIPTSCDYKAHLDRLSVIEKTLPSWNDSSDVYLKVFKNVL